MVRRLTHVVLDSIVGNLQGPGDFFVRQSGCNNRDDFNLSGSQPKLPPVCLKDLALKIWHRILDGVRPHPIPTGHHCPDAFNQQLRGRALEQDAARSLLYRLDDLRGPSFATVFKRSPVAKLGGGPSGR